MFRVENKNVDGGFSRRPTLFLNSNTFPKTQTGLGPGNPKFCRTVYVSVIYLKNKERRVITGGFL